jgi:seryl-tRNA synthetase
MRKLLFTLILILTASLSNFAQETTCEGDKCITSRSFIDDARKAFELVVAQRKAITDLETANAKDKNVIKELERLQNKPCQSAIESSAVARVNAYKELAISAKENRKAANKLFNAVMNETAKANATGCGYDAPKGKMARVWNIAEKTILPFATNYILVRALK